MDGQVSAQEKVRRVALLEDLCASLHAEFFRENKGIREKVLFESKEKDGMMGGYTGNYIRITRPYDPALAGQVADITI
jgi:threonylcarbamoyladenosine tRNA methylthiotransferase MtaB